MKQNDIDILRTKTDAVVRFTCTDGEVIIGRVLLLSDEDADVVCDVISTTNSSRYKARDDQPAYAINLSDIASVEVIDDKRQIRPD